MKITVTIDDDLIGVAQELSGITNKTNLMREALKALIDRESVRKLASLGDSIPRLGTVLQRRPSKESRKANLRSQRRYQS